MVYVTQLPLNLFSSTLQWHLLLLLQSCFSPHTLTHAPCHGCIWRYLQENWTEFEVAVNAEPRYPGHLQPNIPADAPGFGVGAAENNPAVMEKKINKASANGVDMFVFDWYWYVERRTIVRILLGGTVLFMVFVFHYR